MNLLRDRPPSEGSATKILCLACGDVRNILFTLSTEGPSANRSYEWAFCDSEPAVLARNVFLLAFLAARPSKGNDASEVDHLWELYYHIFIGSDAKKTLARHATHLVEASTSSDEWNKSRYGVAIRFYSESTLQEMRQYWQHYLDACTDDKEREIRDAVQETVRQYRLDEGRVFPGGTRATGVHAFSSSLVMSAAFRAYWKTGVVAGNSNDCSALKHDGGGHANPLMYVSSAPFGQFAVHYGTDPLHGFHLAEVFDAPGGERDMLQRLARTAKSQFREWCASFTKHIRMGGLRMFFHCGEAVGMCYELQSQAKGPCLFEVPPHLHTYSRPWSSSCLNLSLGRGMDACSSFDVIDTSNISDHVGILNLIPAIQPLLNDSALSVLYTETLLLAAEEATRYLDELLRVDVVSFGLVAGIAPTASLLGITSEHFGSEAFLGHYGRNTGGQSQMRMRISWKKPSGGDCLAAPVVAPLVLADADDMASLLFQWYLNMFAASEDMSALWSVSRRRVHTSLSHDLGPYTRTTLIALIGLARKHVQTDWSRCIGLLMDKIQDDRTLMIGSNSLQELSMLLHIAGMYEVPTLNMPPKAAAMKMSAIANSRETEALRKWPDMSSVVAVALVVPRDRLHVLTSADLNRVGTPGFHLSVYQEMMFDNSFHSIHACFGKLVIDENSETSTIEEDALGWRGHSDLIVTGLVSAFQFLMGGQSETRAALVLNTCASNAYFMPSLGPHMRLFTTSTDDPQNFRILPTLPGVRRSEQATSLPKQYDSGRAEPIVSVSPRDGRLDLLTFRQDCSSNSERGHLQDGLDVQTIQESPCTITLKLGKQCRRLCFPFPVDGSHSRTRIARKQLWVEVIVPISYAARPNGYALRPFPVVFEKGQSMSWGMGRINLAESPIVAADMSLETLSAFLDMTLSAKEKDFQGAEPSQGSNFSRSLFDMKESLALLCTSFACKHRSSGRKYQAFRLAVDNDSDTLIFANALRHDQDSGSICLDAHVVPLTPSRVQKLHRALTKTASQMLSIRLSDQEAILWKHILPALVERCRHSWQHQPTCEYHKNNNNNKTISSPKSSPESSPEATTTNCPLSILHGHSPICSCGEGQKEDLSHFPREFSSDGFAQFATRIALTPLSAHPMVETMALNQVLGDSILSSSSSSSASSSAAEKRRQKDGKKEKDGEKEKCGCCGRVADLKACAGCGLVKYCNKDCQRQDWKGHKVECGKGKKSIKKG